MFLDHQISMFRMISEALPSQKLFELLFSIVIIICGISVFIVFLIKYNLN